MTEQDAFFTHTIVGAPQSVLLGPRLRADAPFLAGLAIDPVQGTTRLGPAWQPWAIERLAGASAGVPRPRPGRVRRWLERHALAIAIGGLLAWVGALAVLGTALGWWPHPAR